MKRLDGLALMQPVNRPKPKNARWLLVESELKIRAPNIRLDDIRKDVPRSARQGYPRAMDIEVVSTRSVHAPAHEKTAD